MVVRSRNILFISLLAAFVCVAICGRGTQYSANMFLNGDYKTNPKAQPQYSVNPASNIFLEHAIISRQASPFSGPTYLPPIEYIKCGSGQQCVRNNVCQNGYYTQKQSPISNCNPESDVCCTYKPPATPAPTTPKPYNTCRRDQDCVSSADCQNGEIVSPNYIHGGSTSTCYSPNVCCLMPSTTLTQNGYQLKVPDQKFPFPSGKPPAQKPSQPTYTQPQPGYTSPQQPKPPAKPTNEYLPPATQPRPTQQRPESPSRPYTPQRQPTQPLTGEDILAQPIYPSRHTPSKPQQPQTPSRYTPQPQPQQPQQQAQQPQQPQQTPSRYTPQQPKQPQTPSRYTPQPQPQQPQQQPQQPQQPQQTPSRYTPQQQPQQPQQTPSRYTPQQQPQTPSRYTPQPQQPQPQQPQQPQQTPSRYTPQQPQQTPSRYTPQQPPQPPQPPQTPSRYTPQQQPTTPRPYYPQPTQPRRQQQQPQQQPQLPERDYLPPNERDNEVPTESRTVTNRVPGSPQRKPLRGEHILSPSIVPKTQQNDNIPRTPSKCASALVCTAEEYCNSIGVISDTPVDLSPSAKAFRVPLTDCNLPGSGAPGKCCRDSNYVDPWPVNMAGVCGTRNRGTKPTGIADIDANFGEIPWQAMVLKQSTKTLLCGGAIIGAEHVLTTAECVRGLSASDCRVKAGEWELGNDSEPLPFQLVGAKYIKIHPTDDMAIIRLDTPLQFASHIKPICISDQDPSASEKCITTGWGKQAIRAHEQGAIMHVTDTNTVSRSECGANQSGVCSSTKFDACQFDSGSALACGGSSSILLKGVFSAENGCGEGQPVRFTKPDIKWINEEFNERNKAIFKQFN